ncbi:transposase [Kineococcus aurantiacus]|uniref:Transposase n=1 Tax=Kineococcus aurantiacus TaxID=37633 RepID=A0A7Y9DQZ7_9ACTN|nr:transposase [Kineococcus aurantiacus]
MAAGAAVAAAASTAPFRRPGRLPRNDRAASAGIAHVRTIGCTWGQVPTEQFGCSGVTCWRRLRDWTEADVWPQLHQVLLEELRVAGKLDLEAALQLIPL